MSLANSLFGTSHVGGQNTATNLGQNAMNAKITASAYNQAMMANSVPGPLVSKQHQERELRAATTFTVIRALNGYVVSTSDPESYVENRYIASTVQEVKDLVASILVQNKFSEP
jgi:hypothetical protein